MSKRSSQFAMAALPATHLQPLSPPKPLKKDPNFSAASRAKVRISLGPSLLPQAGVAGDDWHPLDVPRSELSLPLTLPTGQTFRWRQTGPSQFTGVIGSHLVSLKHDDRDACGGVSFFLHASSSFCSSSSTSAARSAIWDYLNLDISLGEMWRGFALADRRFDELSRRFGGGARVLRQDPVECVMQFLCSSNNNIARIDKMVGVLSSFGEYLGTVGGYPFHEFPSLERLSVVSEQQLRDSGFGYRAKYIVSAVRALQAKPGGGIAWLASLRCMELHDIIEALSTLPGVGPKVAACIALFSLDQHHAIPVDTHVWKIATRYLIPELAGAKLTARNSALVAQAFVTRFGRYAGWAQNVLFISELPSQKALLLENFANENAKKRKLNYGTLESDEGECR
ncbi:N-glycosylase/DNA lyase OGG1 [Apostasia shenzhenica]|uniref:DNA-(apurinic or apyrimidinic site) lyase n=1 Tax=Apostasia shenzhenica TaxID=1088818 RepID=A0A2H9ZUI2_9ASPA|nr:N-glycosylase/DNA lyase OGG1 [Apostasia shenzhenica]